MPVQVLLRGFAPDIPEDQPVTFSNNLPDSVLCVYCKNVSSKLYRDPHGHGYCEPCKGERTTENGLNCLTCDENFTAEKLVLDETIRSKLGNEMVICPGTTESKAVEMQFSALKVYLKGISCESTSRVLSPGKDDDGFQPKATNQQSSQMSTCVICKQTMQKKFLTQHIKSCLKDLSEGRAGYRQGEGNAQQVEYKPARLTSQVKCPLCGSLQDRKAVGIHMSEKCSKRLVQCNFCNADVEVSEKEAHESSCRHRPGTCEHCLRQFPTTAELEDDHHPKCPEMPVHCSFHELGCTFVAARRELPAHEGTATHADILVRHICQLKAENESLRRTIGKQEETYRKTIQKMKDSQNDIAHLKATVSALQEDTRSFQRTITQKDNDIDFLKGTVSALQEDIQRNDIDFLKGTVSALEENIQRFQRTIAEKDNDIQLLKGTVSALQDDLKRVTALQDDLKSKNVDLLEEATTALQEDVKSLQQTITQNNCDTDILKRTVSALQEDMESLVRMLHRESEATRRMMNDLELVRMLDRESEATRRMMNHLEKKTLRLLEEHMKTFQQVLMAVHTSK